MAKLIYLGLVEGETGQGRLNAAVQLVDGSDVIPKLKDVGWVEIPASRWEEYSNSLAGDIDGDGDVDRVDEKLSDEIQKVN